MKSNKLALLATPIVMLAASNASAIVEKKWGFTPYVGADAEWRHMDFHKGLGDNLFRHDYPQGNVYAGLKINDYVGIEAGYEVTNKQVRRVVLPEGALVTGDTLRYDTQFRSTARIQGPHINLTFSLPLSERYGLKLFGSVGIAQLKAKFVREGELIFDPNGVPYSPADFLEAPSSAITTFIRKKSLLRLRFGLEYMLSENWGLRTSIGWENTNKLSIRAIGFSNNRVNGSNSLICSFGTFVTF